MKLKIPNILTIGRIIIVPIFVLTFFIPGLFGDLIPFFLFALASFTDYLDGLLARNSLNPDIKISLVRIIIAAITS